MPHDPGHQAYLDQADAAIDEWARKNMPEPVTEADLAADTAWLAKLAERLERKRRRFTESQRKENKMNRRVPSERELAGMTPNELREVFAATAWVTEDAPAPVAARPAPTPRPAPAPVDIDALIAAAKGDDTTRAFNDLTADEKRQVSRAVIGQAVFGGHDARRAGRSRFFGGDAA